MTRSQLFEVIPVLIYIFKKVLPVTIKWGEKKSPLHKQVRKLHYGIMMLFTGNQHSLNLPFLPSSVAAFLGHYFLFQ